MTPTNRDVFCVNHSNHPPDRSSQTHPCHGVACYHSRTPPIQTKQTKRIQPKFKISRPLQVIIASSIIEKLTLGELVNSLVMINPITVRDHRSNQYEKGTAAITIDPIETSVPVQCKTKQEPERQNQPTSESHETKK